jgi:hypothetical protein
MDRQTDTDLDQADEDILTYDVSDEALEAAAGMEKGTVFSYSIVSVVTQRTFCSNHCC